MPAPSQKAREYAGRDFDDLLKTLDSFTLELREALREAINELEFGLPRDDWDHLWRVLASYEPTPEEKKG